MPKDLLIIGQAPSRSMDPDDPPLWNTTALRALAKYGGVEPASRIYDLASIVNMIPTYPGPQPGNEKYDAYPLDQAIRGWTGIKKLIQLYEFHTIVVLGSANRDMITREEKIRGKNKPEWFTELRFSNGVSLYFSPHPGGTSMWWNDPKHRAAGTAFWRKIFAAQDSSARTVNTLDEGPNRPITQYNVR